MATERVQKPSWQPSSQKKQSPIVPPIIDSQTEADSLPSPKLPVSGVKSKAERDAIRRSLFEKWAGAAPQTQSESEVLGHGGLSTATDTIQGQQASKAIIQLAEFPNKMPEKFSEEIAEANAAALGNEETDFDKEIGPGPFVAGTQKFYKFVESGKSFKWVLNEKKDLIIISPQLKHSVAAGGADVVTAGHGKQIDCNKVQLDNDTGHYHTTVESLKLAEEAWKNAKFDVEFKERVDFTAVFNQGNQKGTCTIL